MADDLRSRVAGDVRAALESLHTEYHGKYGDLNTRSSYYEGGMDAMDRAIQAADAAVSAVLEGQPDRTELVAVMAGEQADPETVWDQIVRDAHHRARERYADALLSRYHLVPRQAGGDGA